MDKVAFKFLNIPIFNWLSWDDIDVDQLYFYNVDFLLSELEEYNSNDVCINYSDGLLIIYDKEDGKELYKNYLYKIDTFMDQLNYLWTI